MLELSKVRHRVEGLAAKDPDYEIFGAERHLYDLMPPLAAERVEYLEQQLGVSLPEDYRAFVIQVSEGGAGPGFGLRSLTDMVVRATEDPVEGNLARRPFPLTQPLWGPDELKAFTGGRLDAGAIQLADYGCGIDPYLVVNGAEAGRVWVLDVISDGGVYPFTRFEVGHLHDPRRPFPETVEEMVFTERMTFADWYGDWLEVTEQLLA